MRNSIPTFASERLKFRAHFLEDFPYSAAMWADPVIVKYIGGKPSNEQQAWARFLTYAGHWVTMNYGYWVIEEKTSGQFIGELGYGNFKRMMEPSIAGVPELGWAFIASAHGKGYATEAVNAALNWGQSSLKAEKIACIIDPNNTASIRVAEKCGFKEYCKTTYAGAPINLYFRSL